MKKFICLLLFICSIKFSEAQFPVPGSNIQHSSLSNFEGTWRWASGNSELIIKLKKVNVHYSAYDFSEDVLIGSHKYIKDGIVIEDFLDDFPNINTNVFSSIFLFTKFDGSIPFEVKGNIKDISKGKKQLLRLKYENISGVQVLTWLLESRDDSQTAPPSTPGITLPTDLILLRN